MCCPSPPCWHEACRQSFHGCFSMKEELCSRSHSLSLVNILRSNTVRLEKSPCPSIVREVMLGTHKTWKVKINLIIAWCLLSIIQRLLLWVIWKYPAHKTLSQSMHPRESNLNHGFFPVCKYWIFVSYSPLHLSSKLKNNFGQLHSNFLRNILGDFLGSNSM